MSGLSKNHSGSYSSLAVLFRFFILMLPAVLFFSYHPVMYLGASESMYFELSLPLLWLAAFFVVGMIVLWREGKIGEIFKGWRLLLFPAFLTLSVAWSGNLTRGVLTAGVLWLVYFAGFSMYILRDYFREELVRRRILGVFFGAALLVCVWCVVQCVLDLAGVSREYSLMCAGCTYSMFGFPHPNGFAIEPQFMGNLLLAPAIMSIWFLTKDESNSTFRGRVPRARLHGARALLLGSSLRNPLKVLLPFIFKKPYSKSKKQNSKNQKRETSRGVFFTTAKSDSARYCSTDSSSVAVVKNTTGSFQSFWFLLLCFFIFIATLFLTFSRGAIYAFGVAMVFMSAFLWVKDRKLIKRIIGVWGVTVLAFLFTLNVQGIMAAVGPTKDTYMDGVGKVLNHLSLGIIDIRNRDVSEKSQALESVESDEVLVPEGVELGENEAIFDGYVAESTDTRVRLSRAAVEIWSRDFRTMMFGVGLGGAGQALYESGNSPAPREITQNQYTSLLLETGLVGVGLAAFSLLVIVRFLMKKSAVSVPILTLMVAYGVSLVFFSGLPNALHIYLLPVVFYISMRKKLVS